MRTTRLPTLGLACFIAVSQACTGWTESQLPMIDGTMEFDGVAHPVAISDSGTIAGYGCAFELPYYTDCYHGIEWDHGVMTDLRGFDGYEAWAFAINDHEQIAGVSHPDGPGTPEGILWCHGVDIHLGALVFPTDINNGAQVVGTSWETVGPARSILWDNGDTTLLWTGTVTAINDSGRAVGNSPAGAVMWRNGTVVVLGAFTARDIDFSGKVLGRRFSDNHTILWENGVITDIGLGPEYDMVRMNDHGLIVGKRLDRAIAWETGTVYDLGAGYAEGVNNVRQIVGYGPWPVGPWTEGPLIWNPW